MLRRNILGSLAALPSMAYAFDLKKILDAGRSSYDVIVVVFADGLEVFQLFQFHEGDLVGAGTSLL